MYKDLQGQQFGRLTVIKKAGAAINGCIKWECKCTCGKTTIVRSTQLISGNTKSCGCLQRETMSKKFKTHGLSNTRLYIIWQAMKQRCYNPKYDYYQNYGGKGIIICDEWKSDFMSFYNWSMENGYNDSLSIDRIDINKNYSPDNCRWATPMIQSNNKGDTTYVIYHGEKDSLTNMCRKLNVNRSTIQKRCRIYKCSFEEAVDNYQKPGEFVDYWKRK